MSLQDLIYAKTIENIFKAIIHAYTIMKSNNPFIKVPIENERRNHLIETLRSNKLICNGNCIITSEESTYDDTTFKDLGRMDVRIYFGWNKGKTLVFECKRFISSTITTKNIKEEYFGEGIERFTTQKKYPVPSQKAGMISFVESGDFNKLNQLLSIELNNVSISFADTSLNYSHDYCYQGLIDGILFSHILLNFAS